MRLSVHRVQQQASGGSYVVIFEADVEVTEHPDVDVKVMSVDPSDTEPQLVEEARQAIARGVARVLKPIHRGAYVQVGKLRIKASDFKSGRFEEFTAAELEKQLVEVNK